MPDTGSLATYDRLPYRSLPVAEAHPDYLGALASLYGLEAAPAPECRVLELGCANGGNLLAMAAALPGSSFVGVDGSASQIEDGERLRRSAGLENARLVAAPFASLSEDLGEFDYVVCHGVFSWVSARTQEELLALCGRRLAPRGLLYLSFSTYPGGHSRQMLREMMLFHVRDVFDPVERVRRSRELVELLGRLAKDEQGTYRARLAKMAEALAATDDGHLFHDLLEEENRPLYFHEVVRRAAGAGLRYVASTSTPWDAFPPPEIEGALAPLEDRVVREQYLDFFSDRTFRRSVFGRADSAVALAPDEARARDLFASGRARPVNAEPDLTSGVPEDFAAGPDVRITTGRPFVKAALAALHEAMPRALSFDELFAASRRMRVGADPDATEQDLARLLARSFPAGLLRLSPRPSPCAWPPPDRPLAVSFARVQAREGSAVTTLFHRTAELEDLDRLVLQACDGSRERPELARVLGEAVERGEFRLAGGDGALVEDADRIAAASREAIDVAVVRLARLGLFAAPASGY